MDPWATKWIKNVCDHIDTKRAKAHLKIFVHESQRPEINNEIVEEIKLSTLVESHFMLRELQHKPRFIHQSYTKNTLDITTSILTDNGKILSTKALIDSGCTGSSIDAAYIKQNHIPTHQLPRKIPIYNVIGTPNSRGPISFFVTV